MVECVFDVKEGKTALLCTDGDVGEDRQALVVDGCEYVPFSPGNNLLTHRVVLLPSEVGTISEHDDLIADIRAFIHRYLEVSPAFEEASAHYILLTWVYDHFNELPYLRVRGQYGSGKSRFLLTVGSLCYKPIFASGASTISPIFRLIDQVGGTLVIDEADFWASDERSEVVKILNNGNARGFPVLRNDISPSKEFNPRAFNIFGPKLVATRHAFEDEALESRCLTEILSARSVRKDIPVSLPSTFHTEAEAIRNRLLAFRFAWEPSVVTESAVDTEGLSARRAQIIAPLLTLAGDVSVRGRLVQFAGSGAAHPLQSTAEASRCVLSCVKKLFAMKAPLSISAITAEFTLQWSERYSIPVTHRWVGTVLRRLGLHPHKSNGVYILPPTDLPLLLELFQEYGLVDIGDIGDVHQDAGPVVAVESLPSL